MIAFALFAMLFTWDWGTSIWAAREVWAPLQLFLAGADVQVVATENVVRDRPTVYVSNHQSTIDILVLLRALPVNLRYVAKSQLRWVPLMGWFMALTGHVFINRGNSAKAIASLDKPAERIRKGLSMVVFAEGTRSPDVRILPFKKAPFVLALK